MKITIVTGAFFPVPPIMGGAVEKVWFALGREFARHGHEVVQVSRTHPTLAEKEVTDGVLYIRVKGFDQPRSLVWLKLLDLVYSWRVRRVLPRADILVTNTFWLPMLERTRQHGAVYVHVQRGPKGQMRFYRHVARLLAVSRAIADQIVAEAPCLRAKVRVIPNALPFRIENAADENRQRVILYVGRIHPEKGLELFLRTLSQLPAELLSGWGVRIVGPHETQFGGGGEPFLEQLRRLGQESGAHVEWLGKIFDPKALSAQYRAALLFVYPSLAEAGEALPVAPLEAMANGCVPIVSSLACFRDYIDDNVTGFTFDHRDPEPEKNFGQRLLSVLRLSREEILAMGKRAQAKAREFEVEKVAARYLEDFESLLPTQPNEQRSSAVALKK